MLLPEQAAKDYRTDADLHAACEPDAKQLCADVNPGEGRVQDCLRDKAVSVSWECQEELFRQVLLRHRAPLGCQGQPWQWQCLPGDCCLWARTRQLILRACIACALVRRWRMRTTCGSRTAYSGSAWATRRSFAPTSLLVRPALSGRLVAGNFGWFSREDRQLAQHVGLLW